MKMFKKIVTCTFLLIFAFFFVTFVWMDSGILFPAFAEPYTDYIVVGFAMSTISLLPLGAFHFSNLWDELGDDTCYKQHAAPNFFDEKFVCMTLIPQQGSK